MRLNLLQSTTELQCKCNYTPSLVFVIQAVTLTLDMFRTRLWPTWVVLIIIVVGYQRQNLPITTSVRLQ